MKLITLKDACERLQISRPPLDKLRKSGNFIQVIKVGERKLFVHEDELEDYIAKGGVQ